MKSNDRQLFTQLMMGIGVLYNKPLHEALIEIYWRALQRFDFPAIQTALQAHITHPDKGQFMPKPADVVHYLEGSSITQALKAWAQVVQAIRLIGTYSTVVFDDPIIHAVIEDMGGWIQLGQLRQTELPFRGHEFEKRYSGYVLHPPSRYPKQLTGIFEQKNQLLGFEVTPPLLIGDKEKANQVYEQGSNLLSFHYQPVLPLLQAAGERIKSNLPTYLQPSGENV